MVSHKIRNLNCRVCDRRKARRANGCCDACYALVEAEKLHKQLGIPTESEIHQRWRKIATRYNRLAAKGDRTQKQIAEKMGMPLRQLNSMIYRMKRSAKIPIINLRDVANGIGKPTAKITPRTKPEHGGGKWGVPKCKCDLCKAVRRETNRAVMRARREAEKNKQTPP